MLILFIHLTAFNINFLPIDNLLKFEFWMKNPYQGDGLEISVQKILRNKSSAF